MTEILNNDILESGDLIKQIVQVMHTDFKWITDVPHYINDQVNGIKDRIIANNVISLKNTVITLVFAVLICLSAFIGPGGKNILNDEPRLAPGVKNTLETKLEQNPILEQKQKKKEKPKNNIVLCITKTTNPSVVRTGQGTATLLYEKWDIESTTIVALSMLLSNHIATDFRGGFPTAPRRGIHLDTVTSEGAYIAPQATTWPLNGVSYKGIICPALRHPDPDVKFVDYMGRDILYNGDTMLVPTKNVGNMHGRSG